MVSGLDTTGGMGEANLLGLVVDDVGCYVVEETRRSRKLETTDRRTEVALHTRSRD